MDERTGVYRVRAFANLAGVTVRTLHHYDRLALLKPKRTGSGYRIYGGRDLARLEQIVALKFLGLPLRHIKKVLDREGRPLADVLRGQRRALEEKRRRLDRAIQAIAEAEPAIGSTPAADTALLRHIIEVIDMQSNNEAGETMKKYYTDAAWDELARRRAEMTPQQRAAAEDAGRRWQALFADVEGSFDEDPAGPRAQALVDRWQGLIHEFTGGDRAIEAGLGRAWNDRMNWPAPLQAEAQPFSDPRVWDFIRRAIAAKPRP